MWCAPACLSVVELGRRSLLKFLRRKLESMVFVHSRQRRSSRVMTIGLPALCPMNNLPEGQCFCRIARHSRASVWEAVADSSNRASACAAPSPTPRASKQSGGLDRRRSRPRGIPNIGPYGLRCRERPHPYVLAPQCRTVPTGPDRPQRMWPRNPTGDATHGTTRNHQPQAHELSPLQRNPH